MHVLFIGIVCVCVCVYVCVYACVHVHALSCVCMFCRALYVNVCKCLYVFIACIIMGICALYVFLSVVKLFECLKAIYKYPEIIITCNCNVKCHGNIQT